MLGAAGLHPRSGPGVLEIGYWIRADELNRGFATEASAALARVAFEVHGVHRVEVRCDPDNVRSAAVPRQLGFVHEATLRQQYQLRAGSYRDTMVWSMLHPDFYNSPAASYRVAAFDAVGARLSYRRTSRTRLSRAVLSTTVAHQPLIDSSPREAIYYN